MDIKGSEWNYEQKLVRMWFGIHVEESRVFGVTMATKLYAWYWH